MIWKLCWVCFIGMAIANWIRILRSSMQTGELVIRTPGQAIIFSRQNEPLAFWSILLLYLLLPVIGGAALLIVPMK